MAWLILLASAVCEAVWAVALDRSNGFTEPVPVAVFLVGLALSMAGLGWAASSLPIGTAYAVWVGVGATLTVTYSLVTGSEGVSVAKLLFIAGIVAAVAGLKMTRSGTTDSTRPPSPDLS